MKRFPLSTTATLLSLLATMPVVAQTEDAAEDAGIRLEEIVVTAQRRSENMQSVPIAVTAATSDRLAAVGVGGTWELAQIVPGLQMSVSAGFSRPRLRGVGTDSNGPGIENPVAVYLDGVYLASSSGSLLSLSNIDRLEVLKGPQGTLFGRNATGGLIQIVTKTPAREATGDFEIRYGSYDTASADGYVAGGLSETVAADIAVHYLRQGDGYGENLATGRDVLRDDDDRALRSRILWEPGDSTSVILAGDYSYKESSALTFYGLTAGTEAYATFNNFFTANGPYPFPADFYDVDLDAEPRGELEAWGTSLDVDHQFGDIDFKSITSFRDTRYYFSFDLDATREDLLSFGTDTLATWEQFSQELQLSSSANEALTWTAGLYYFHSSDGYDPLDVKFSGSLPAIFFGIPASRINTVITDEQETDSYAAYGQATWELFPETRLTLGGRYTDEKRSLDGVSDFLIDGVNAGSTPQPPAPIPTSQKFENFSYRIALDHNFTPDILGYVSYNTGFKSGGYNPNVPDQAPYKEEEIESAEAGVKTEWLDRRVRINAAGFYYWYDNIQVARYVATSLAIYNGAKAEIYGADLDLEALLFDGFTVTGGLSLLHDRFTDFPDADYSYFASGKDCIANPPGSSAPFTCDAGGNRLAYSSSFSANIGFDWTTPLAGGDFDLNVNLYHSSGFFGSVDNNPLNRQEDYDQLNASISWTDPTDRYKFSLWGRNLLDEEIARARLITPQSIWYNPAPPLTFGGTISFHF